MEELTKKQLLYLRALSHMSNKGSVYAVGKRFFQSEMSIYPALDKFQFLGYIDMIKLKKKLIVTILPKGQKFINDSF